MESRSAKWIHTRLLIVTSAVEAGCAKLLFTNWDEVTDGGTGTELAAGSELTAPGPPQEQQPVQETTEAADSDSEFGGRGAGRAEARDSTR